MFLAARNTHEAHGRSAIRADASRLLVFLRQLVNGGDAFGGKRLPHVRQLDGHSPAGDTGLAMQK